MKKMTAIFLALLMLLGLCACGGGDPAGIEPDGAGTQQAGTGADDPEPDGFEVTDLLGRTVAIPANASRFACIGPGALRLYCYVADKAALVGVESAEIEWGSEGRPYAMSMGEISGMTVIGPGGPGNAPDAELLFAAAPDVIFSMYHSEAAVSDELQEKTGIPVVTLSYGEAEVFDQRIYDSLALIGRVTGHEDRAEAVVGFMEDIERDLDSRTAEIADKPLVYMGCQSNRGSHGIESTVGNYVLFDALNIRNAAAEAGVPGYAMIDKEQVLEMDPDIIIIDAGGYGILSEDYAANPEFYEALSAVKNGRFYMQMPYNWYYTNLEIALADAYYIGAVVYPDAFSDIDIEQKFDEISDFMLGIFCYESIAGSYFGGFQQVKLGK